jgi:site-specific recombinase XerD
VTSGLTMPGIRPRHYRFFEQGVHIRVVQEVLGHTRVTTTERYTHVVTLQVKDASERMSEALWGRG